MVNYKDYITDEQLYKLLQVLQIHNKMVNKMNPRDVGGFMKQKVFKEHKQFINNLYEELDNVDIQEE